MKKMSNAVQYYAWGSKTALTSLYGIANPEDLPMAELWMGAHPKSPSAVDVEGQSRSLRDVIAAHPSQMLGDAVAKRFGELPFLFKVLCADQPLSIQVHPSKSAAEEGFARENAASVPLSSPERNYKDANHKPELVYALTPFKAINGFRERNEMVTLLTPVADAHPEIAHFLRQPSPDNLAQLFSTLLSLQQDEKAQALTVLKNVVSQQTGEPWQTIHEIAEYYPDDSGLFSPLLLNVITLQPGQAMFLFAETPHAYLHGVALEVMANSDNVLRAGLTPKYIDIPELMANLKFDEKPASQLLTQPEIQQDGEYFPIPVDDFAFSIHTVNAQPLTLHQESAALLFCIEGEATVTNRQQQLVLKPGESCFVAAADAPVSLTGQGRVARVYNTFN
ncbi:mannose-6-phosphate isomerase [Pantoea stewartii]|uniref:mannose-6-phosphate isomerase n=1 Tax=Pantoea TaxID=53335 RepID=UPI0005438FBB|nr:mannose-6-phosphate isomerase [Pantoea stewartii]KHE02255.1 mannose-6-phosphate isomerase [Pantoea stewartii]KHN61762.1 mannose-6-phosphate isomerase [Pantoea stewartii]NRH22492.1 mannose-6-phosphate isomerase [Pantoea stewartii]